MSNTTDDTIYANISAKNSKVEDIRKALINYWRWVTEGEPEYGKGQHYYDWYHNQINYRGDGIYGYNIQVFDSPEGDEWMRGKFKLEANNEIVLL
jgi:hypothetical protein